MRTGERLSFPTTLLETGEWAGGFLETAGQWSQRAPFCDSDTRESLLVELGSAPRAQVFRPALSSPRPARQVATTSGEVNARPKLAQGRQSRATGLVRGSWQVAPLPPVKWT